MDYGDNDVLSSDEHLENWVMAKCDSWRDHYESNYSERFEEFYRLWRGIWAAEDMERKSERSRIISPALQQAVESSVAEIEEATFGRGSYFDITDDMGDAEAQDVVYLRQKLHEDFEKTQIRKQVGECLINSAVFGTGVAEVVLEEVKEMAPATQPIMDGQLQAVGVNVTDRTVVKLRPVMPQNFLIDPVATSIEDAIGVAVDEFVPRHKVQQLQEEGVYRNVYVGQAASDYDLEPDQDLTSYDDDKVRLTKYYGLVPRYLLEIGEKEALLDEDEDIADIEVEEPENDEQDASYYVEAIVVVANGGILLKAEANPYMMQDRPVVAFPWDVVPGRFWGRGVCEKGYNSQKALDTELRARIDALALTVYVGQAASDYDLEPDQDLTSYDDDKVRLTKYYGLVPRYLLEIGEKEALLDEDEDIADIEVEEPENDEDASYYVEAIVVVANGGILLKAEANPYMMQDRPVVAFPWDVVPGRFWGRGVCEKGYNSQKALDTELRARIDALALTVHPMMAMDATRLPRGSRPEVRPGKIILTNGDPKTVLNPFNFGQVSQITFAQAAELQKMVQMSTGAIDSAGIPGSINGDATAAGISMSLGAIIKRHKRTLINFQQSFLIPFVKKAACRYMQFDPENYPVKDYKFNTTSTLGIIAREYEVTQLVQLLQTMPAESPLYNTLIQSIIDNMNLSNREELMAKLGSGRASLTAY
jgi:hypothetical protein